VLDRSCDRPWYRHNYYENEYPRGYYNNTYAPRQSLGSNTVLRAYDENQRRPLFVNRETNREVAVQYNVVNAPRGNVNSVPTRNNPIVQSGGYNSVPQNPRTVNNLNGQVRNNTFVQAPRNTTVVQNSRGDVNATTVTRGNNTFSTPRNQVYTNSNAAAVATPVRNNISTNQYQSVPRHDNVAPVRNVMPVHSQPEMRTGQQVVPSNRQPVMSRQYIGNSQPRGTVNTGSRQMQAGRSR